jgi:Antirestriction protein
MTTSTITNTIVPESERMNIVDGLFGMAYMLKLEPAVFSIAEALAEEYTGGYWEFHDLSNGGFYMAPQHDTEFNVSCENGFEGKLSPDAFGIAVCLYAYSELSFVGDRMAKTCAQQYHLLREYAAEHPEAGAIYRAID